MIHYSHPPLHPSGPGTAPPQHPDVNAQNQQYYEFQWRVLNLCAEFYNAAEELVVCMAYSSKKSFLKEYLQKGANPLVIAQCYQSGPSNKVDPLAMLNEAKRICDTLVRAFLFFSYWSSTFSDMYSDDITAGEPISPHNDTTTTAHVSSYTGFVPASSTHCASRWSGDHI